MKAKLPAPDNVVLNLISSQTQEGNTEKTELSVTGLFEKHTDGSITLKFKEIFSDQHSSVECFSKITVYEDGKLVLSRFGSFRSEMIFEENKRYNTAYDTPYGTIDLGVYSRNVSYSEYENYSEIKLNYTLDSFGEVFSENEMKIIIKKRTEKNVKSDR